MYKQPKLKKEWNYSIFLQALFCYLRYTDRHLDVFLLSLAVILSELQKKLRKTELQKKSTQKNSTEEHTLFG